ncbi:helix-turn-helix domain-containing protein [Nevskia ramosa]|uniref:helix-turn-helix domain-containing protein n=1 Tax=Nevskia ramosa TaxID=64002 RepID=UPI0003B309CF|nr:helix-turn-helix domain-containing protein [Nevskia ramosa]
MNAIQPTSAASTRFGDSLRRARAVRRRSQLDLALSAGLSQRHLSFLESGRSQPSRAMLLRLAEALDLGLADRNHWLIAAGFAPIYPQRAIEAPDMTPVREALARMLRHHEPFPAMVIDRAWNLVMTNEATERMIAMVSMVGGHASADALWQKVCGDGPRNMVQMSLHPEGLRPFVVNADEVVAALLSRLSQEALDHPPSARLREVVMAYPGFAAAARNIDVSARLSPVLATHFRIAGQDLRLFAMLSRFDMPRDLTAEDLRVETLYPADADSEQLLRGMAGSP